MDILVYISERTRDNVVYSVARKYICKTNAIFTRRRLTRLCTYCFLPPLRGRCGKRNTLRYNGSWKLVYPDNVAWLKFSKAKWPYFHWILRGPVDNVTRLRAAREPYAQKCVHDARSTERRFSNKIKKRFFRYLYFHCINKPDLIDAAYRVLQSADENRFLRDFFLFNPLHNTSTTLRSDMAYKRNAGQPRTQNRLWSREQTMRLRCRTDRIHIRLYDACYTYN